MIQVKPFAYRPGEHECERASNSYLMSVVALIAGLPLPIINLIATLAFWFGNKKSTYFVRWHCTQALLSQAVLLVMNSVGFWWTILVITQERSISNAYISYILTIILFNLIEFIATAYTAQKTRNGVHVEWWFYGDLTNELIKPKDAKPGI